MAIRTVPITEFQRKFGEYRDKALTGGLVLTSHGRETLAVVPVEWFHRLRALERQALRVEELTGREMKAIRAARVPSGHEALDRELKPRR